ncbi:thioredoxin family protein [Legionella spiritensis]|uniref:thioredoxin family protein n=1 Tax=Legionella spiritensis TaxID=452 RepID=UPI000F6B8994|nr:thioredoxin family protein [Legionella spiritensis]VEG89992.1 thioredoxin proteins [Legionella spiritensis]
MLKENVSGNELEQLVTTSDIVFVDFWADWCAPCKDFARIYANIAKQYPDVTFASVNIQLEEKLAETFQIRSIPHLIVFKQGIIIYSESGNMPESALKELVEQAEKIDMADIRSKMQDES